MAMIYRVIQIKLNQLLLQPFNSLFSRITWVSRYQKGKTNLDFTEARDSEWQWHQLGRMQVCTSLQTDNHSNTPPLVFLQAGCPSCRPTNSVKALKALQSTEGTKKIEPVSLIKCQYDLWLTNKAYLSQWYISLSFYLQDGGNVSWHRHGTKLRHCRPVYK